MVDLVERLENGRRWFRCPQCNEPVCVTPENIDEPVTFSNGETLTAAQHRKAYEDSAAESFRLHKIQDHILSPINRALRKQYAERFEFTGHLEMEGEMPKAICVLREWRVQHDAEGESGSTHLVCTMWIRDLRKNVDTDGILRQLQGNIADYEVRRAIEVVR